MQSKNTYTFSAPAIRIDFQRIIDEAHETALDRWDDAMPSLIRVSIEGGRVVTLCTRQVLTDALDHFSIGAKLYAVDFIAVDGETRFTTQDGEDGVAGVNALHTDSAWVALLGDFVKELSNRREVRVEVF